MKIYRSIHKTKLRHFTCLQLSTFSSQKPILSWIYGNHLITKKKKIKHFDTSWSWWQGTLPYTVVTACITRWALHNSSTRFLVSHLQYFSAFKGHHVTYCVYLRRPQPTLSHIRVRSMSSMQALLGALTQQLKGKTWRKWWTKETTRILNKHQTEDNHGWHLNSSDWLVATHLGLG